MILGPFNRFDWIKEVSIQLKPPIQLKLKRFLFYMAFSVKEVVGVACHQSLSWFVLYASGRKQTNHVTATHERNLCSRGIEGLKKLNVKVVLEGVYDCRDC